MTREFHWRIGDQDHAIRLDGDSKGGTLRVGDTEHRYRIQGVTAEGGWIEVEGRLHRFFANREGHEIELWIGGRTYRLENLERRHATHAAPPASGEIRAQMPGKIVRVDVSEGAEVGVKQPLLIMESMKMETTLYAPRAGRIAKVNCAAGQVVEMGELLVMLEEIEEAAS